MALYGVDVYGKTLYGTDLGVDYQVENLAAVQSDFGRVTVSWDAPRQNNWTALTLVRSAYGFPVAVTDGAQVASYPDTGSHTSYDDVGLAPGYWYYTVFASVPFLAWSAATAYSTGDRVSYAGTVWICVAAYSVNATPGTDPTVWLATDEVVLWHPAGSVAALAVDDHGYGATLEELTPPIYKALPGISTDTGTANQDLTAMLGVVGFAFSQIEAELDDLLNGYHADTTRQDRLYAIGTMLGIDGEMAASARFQRLRTLQAAALNQRKGTARGITDLIFAATGLSAAIATGRNLLLTQDQSAFVTPAPLPWDAAEPYQLSDEVLYLGARYTVTGYNLTITSANYVADAVTGSPNALSTITVSSATHVKEAAVAASSITIPFTVLASGSYVAWLAMDCGPDFGVLTTSIDGQAVTAGILPTFLGRGRPSTPAYTASTDLYAASLSKFNTLLTFPTALAPGAHTLVLSAATKNASSSGFSLAFGSAQIIGSPLVYPPGNPPTGASTSAAQWSASAASATTTTYANPVTGGQGTWCVLGVNTALSTGYLGS